MTASKRTLIWLAIMIVAVAFLSGCRTIKTDEKSDIRDTVRTEYIEKIVEVPVVVEVEVPAESKERETSDSTSFLETSFAESTASLIWRDGLPYLFHNLKNKPQKIKKETKVPVKQTFRKIYRTRYVTKTKTIQKELPWWKKALVWTGGILLVLNILGIAIKLLGNKFFHHKL